MTQLIIRVVVALLLAPAAASAQVMSSYQTNLPALGDYLVGLRPCTAGVAGCPATGHANQKVTIGSLFGAGLPVTTPTIAVPTIAEPDFTVVVLPDQQMMVESYQAIYEAEYAWIVANRVAQNIVAVASTGDMTDDSSVTQYDEAAKAFAAFAAAGILSLPVVGNHDSDGSSSAGGPTPFVRAYTGFDRVFPLPVGQAWFGGSMAGSRVNSWIKLTVGSRKLALLALDFVPSNTELAWALGVMQANADREFIVVTHSYLNLDSTRTVAGDRYGMTAGYVTSAPGDTSANDADGTWASLRQAPNLLTIMSGHQFNSACSPTSAYRPGLGAAGNIVHQMVFNHQCGPNGGDGYIGLMKFSPSTGTIAFSSYSTNTGATDATNDYALSWGGVRAVPALSVTHHLAAESVATSGDVDVDGMVRVESGLNVRGGPITLAGTTFLGGDATSQYNKAADLRFGIRGSIFGGSALYLNANAAYDGSDVLRHQTTGTGSQLALYPDGQMILYAIPTGSADAAASVTNVFRCMGVTHNCGVATTAPQTKFDVEGTFRVAPHTPASATEACVKGQMVDDANYHYACVDTNTWKRVALATWP